MRAASGWGIRLRFYTEQECEDWLRRQERVKPDAAPGAHKEHVRYPPEHYRIFYVAHWVATNLTYRRPALLWITEWGIWPSSETWPLYYKLLRAYSDGGLPHEAPRHLCLEHETEDLASFLQVAMQSGWGGYILTEADYVNAFFSHDESV